MCPNLSSSRPAGTSHRRRLPGGFQARFVGRWLRGGVTAGGGGRLGVKAGGRYGEPHLSGTIRRSWGLPWRRLQVHGELELPNDDGPKLGARIWARRRSIPEQGRTLRRHSEKPITGRSGERRTGHEGLGWQRSGHGGRFGRGGSVAVGAARGRWGGVGNGPLSSCLKQ